MSKSASTVREQAVLMGDARSLVGIHCTPTRTDDVSGITVVILNSGIIHRVGANRLHVEVARSLASMGFPTLRFDLSGIGDSLPRTDDLSLFDGVLADVRTALEHLTALRPGTTFVLIGLCSGAVHGLVYGATDPRVKGLVLLDLMIPRTSGFYFRKAAQRLSKWSTWRKILTGKSRLLRPAAPAPLAAGVDQPVEMFASDEMFDQLAQRLRIVIARDTKMLAVFTDGLENQHNYRNQMLDGFPTVDFTNCLQLEYFRDTDHTFSSEASRQLLIDTISGWLTSTPALQLKLESKSDVTAAGPADSAAIAVTTAAADKSSHTREDLEF